MKKTALVISSLLISMSAFAGEQLNCMVARTTTNPSSYDKLVFSGAIEKNDLIYIKPNGDAGKMNTSSSSAEQILGLDKSIVIVASIQDQDISMAVGSFVTTGGKVDYTSDAWSIANKAGKAVLISSPKNVSVICEVK